MILILVDNELNRRAASQVSERYATQNKTAQRIETLVRAHLATLEKGDDTLVLLDLSGDGYFQKHYTGRTFANRLLEMGLPPSVTTIELIISDVLMAQGKYLATFASDLALNLNLASKGKNMAIVKAYSYKVINEYGIIFIAPPSTTAENWRIYGAYRLRCGEEVPQGIVLNAENLLRIDSKKLLWEGENLRNAPSHLIRISHPDTGCGYTLADIAINKPLVLPDSGSHASEKLILAPAATAPSATIKGTAAISGNKKRNRDCFTPEKPVTDEPNHIKIAEQQDEKEEKRPRI